MGRTSHCRGMVHATISLSEGYLDRLHAEAIIAAIEAFTSSQIGLPAKPTNDAGIT